MTVLPAVVDAPVVDDCVLIVPLVAVVADVIVAVLPAVVDAVLPGVVETPVVDD